MIGRLFNQNLTVLKYSPENSSWGSSSSYIEWKTFECTIQPVTGKDVKEGTKLYNEANAKIYTCIIPTLDIKDRVMVNNKIYDLLEIRDAAGRGHHYELIVKVVR